MAINSAEAAGLLMPMNCQDKETNHGNNKIQLQPLPQPVTQKKVAVVYYLSRNGQLEHPHYMQVPLSSSEGLYLRDVIRTLNVLRGQGMASMYSWASKRRYRNAFLWQDLSDDDLIHPCHDQDYILKGSLFFETSVSFRSSISSSSNSRRFSDINNSSSSSDGGEDDSNFPITRRKGHVFSSADDENMITYNAKPTGQLWGKVSNASTQTDNNRKVKTETEETKPDRSNTAKAMQINKSATNSNNKYQKADWENPDGRMGQRKTVMKLIGCGCGSKSM